MTLQQKIWMAGKTLLWAVRPLALYLLMPGLCVMAGIVIRRPNMTIDGFFASSANFYITAGMAAAIIILYRRSKKRGVSFLQEVHLYPKKISCKQAVLSAVFGMAACTAMSAALTLLPIPADFAGQYTKAVGNNYGSTDPWFLILSMLCLAPLLEEFIFRGMMLFRLLSWFDKRTAKLLTASLFALCHANLIWAFYAFLMGLVLGEAAIRTKNTACSIFLHAGFNFPSLFVFFAGKHPYLNELFYGSRLLVALYGISGFLMVLLIWKCSRDGKAGRQIAQGQKSGGWNNR